ncbi:target of rapamycin complex 2 subunit MAPKAP1-like isoform X1 [Apostichopus japonicus]|uniref:target of rapamycin complex 2 subunit MAPKAP1-like isoform X1 n=1 Tax=Stichopus japonicus TaxID=307972 RepID=UPI003AB5D1F5
MALLDDPAFIIAHLRHSFITSDDTGMCEMALMNEEVDWPKRKKELEVKKQHPWNQYEGYDSEQGYEEFDVNRESYEIESSFDYGFRQRSNTAIRLEKLKQDRQAQKKCQRIQWKEDCSSFPEIETMYDEEEDDLFGRKEVKPVQKTLRSALSQQLEQYPQQASNPFSEFAKFDGKAHIGSGTSIKKIGIFLDMCEGDAREFPLEIQVVGTAKVSEVIGLICWHYKNEGYEPPLRDSIDNYCLMIAEEEGEVDDDFPALDCKEAISKFGFSTLALVEKASVLPDKESQESGKDEAIIVNIKSSDGESKLAIDNTQVTLRELMNKALKRRKGIIPTAGPDYLMEKVNDPGVSLDLDAKLSSIGCLNFVMVREHSKRSYVKPSERFRHGSGQELSYVISTQYKSFRVNMLHKLRPTNEIQLGISGEKVEIDPVQQNKHTPAKLLTKQKAITIESDRVAACKILEEKQGKTVFRLTFKSPSHEFKQYDFEASPAKAKEIVRRINHILELRASAVKHDYTLWRKNKYSKKGPKS